MNKIMSITLTSIFLIGPVLAKRLEPDYSTAQPGVRFAPLNIYIDSGNKSLAAYQFELKATTGQIKIVGVEGGSPEAFKEAPYYDPAALQNDRIIIAAFSTSGNLPKGRTQVATIHLQIIGQVEPQYELKLIVAADADGNEIPTKISYKKGE
jgi:hypothetical protein